MFKDFVDELGLQWYEKELFMKKLNMIDITDANIREQKIEDKRKKDKK